ncbi:PucR family transcriptional regulator ligand-binding domain-containing protein [uncultured Merdimonas sp.]|uniref:PucR family transcriptional regulator n=1 Tax=uncultured Merdimonas sp. TaxID=2023269 RepID=UPI00320BA04A
MKELTVRDVLKLPFMDGYRLVAGESGLDNPVHFPNVYDTPHDVCDPILDNLTARHDFYLTAFFYGKDNPDYIITVIKRYLSIQASAVCIIDQYIKDIPPEAAELCNKHKLPVIFISEHVPYSSVISGIIECKLSLESRRLVTNQLLALTSGHISDSEKREIIRELNPSFLSHVLVFFCAMSEKQQEKMLLSKPLYYGVTSLSATYRDGFCLAYSFHKKTDSQLQETIQDITDYLCQNLPGARIGISNVQPISRLGDGISQAYAAADAASPGQTAYYRRLGITRLLVSIQDHPALLQFYKETAGPLLKYDEENHSQLFYTLCCFMENGADYKKTGAAMFLHENTVRYRINSLKEILEYGENEVDFLETLSIIYKIHRLLKP